MKDLLTRESNKAVALAMERVKILPPGRAEGLEPELTARPKRKREKVE